jgi:hypothetical protein
VESNTSNFVTHQQIAALRHCKMGHVRQHLFSSQLVASGCAATVREMEACTEHPSICFKQHAVIEFLSAKGASPIEIHC